MKKHIPNAITCMNLLTGAAGCIFILTQSPHQGIWFVLLAGLFDFFDGFVARLLKVQSAIGKELDSLADAISFGMLPATYMYVMIQQAHDEPWLKYVGLLIAAFSALRLAKFNIDDRQSDKFIGLPTPANAIMLTSLSLLPVAFTLPTWAYLIITALSCFLLISPLVMIALKFKGKGIKGNELKYALIALVILFFAIFGLKALPFVIPAYILLSIIGNLFYKRGV